MNYIKNYSELAINSKREIVLDLLNEALLTTRNSDKVDNYIVGKNILLKAKNLKIKAEIFSDNFQSEAELAGIALIKATKKHSALIAIGKTTHLKIKTDGKGGRNQTLVLASLYDLDKDTVIAAINVCGSDESIVAGAIGDLETLEKAKKLGINPLEYLNDDNSFVFFKNTQDYISTDRLDLNIFDLIIVYKE